MHNFKLKKYKFKYLVDNMIIDLWFFGNFLSIENIKRKCNLTVEFSKCTSNKKKLSEVII